MKLIGFTGAGGTGKSTVAKHFNNVVLSPVDKVRKIIYGPKAKFGDIVDPEEFILFQHTILRVQDNMLAVQEMRHCNDDVTVIAERSPIDYAAYMAHIDEIDFKYDVNDYIEECIGMADNNFSALVYFPLESFIAKDNPNSSKERNLESAKKTDEYIQGFLDVVEVPVLTLKSTTVEDRVKEINDFIESLK